MKGIYSFHMVKKCRPVPPSASRRPVQLLFIKKKGILREIRLQEGRNASLFTRRQPPQPNSPRRRRGMPMHSVACKKNAGRGEDGVWEWEANREERICVKGEIKSRLKRRDFCHGVEGWIMESVLVFFGGGWGGGALRSEMTARVPSH